MYFLLLPPSPYPINHTVTIFGKKPSSIALQRPHRRGVHPQLEHERVPQQLGAATTAAAAAGEGHPAGRPVRHVGEVPAKAAAAAAAALLQHAAAAAVLPPTAAAASRLGVQ